MTTNELALARAFRDAGFNQDKAETIAQTIFDAIRDNVATKADIALAQSSLHGEIVALRAELKADFASVRSDLQRTELRLMTRGLAALITTVTILFAALHLWPPHPP